MAEDEQFSLCWNNFNTNLSAGFHESLCREDLVDVTLAAEGQIVKAHRLVLSVCSPYFRKMFTQMSVNQHAFVFLKDVSHSALKDLIQFMYCGEVNVKQEALPAFISTAEALQIKGLTDSDPPPPPSTQTPPAHYTPSPQVQQQLQASPRVRQRSSNIGRSYKIDTGDDSGDESKQQTTQIVIQTTVPPHQTQASISTQPPQQQSQQQHHHHQPQASQHITQQPIQTQTHQITSVNLPTSTTAAVVTHKRPAQRISVGSGSHGKRAKSTIDPLDVADASNVGSQQMNVQTTVVTTEVKSLAPQQHHLQQHHTQQQHQHQSQPQEQSSETEYIDLPIELPTKSEPSYTQETGEVDQSDQDGNYVEDESYGDIRYDESYFTEGEDAAVAAGNSATANTSATATTSKAIVKQQSLSDSYMDTPAGDQGNSDAQGDLLLKPIPDAPTTGSKGLTTTGKTKGRPKKETAKKKTPPIIHKIMASVENNPGQPILYASTTKGTVKLVVDGHHFRYTFRKGQFSIFQCCYKEGKEECTMRVVTDQKRVYPLDGEHVHFMQATDKSVTSVQFAPGEVTEDGEDQQIIIDSAICNLEKCGDLKHEGIGDSILARNKDATPIYIKLEGSSTQESVQVNAESTQVGSIVTLPTSAVSNEEPNEFREKIKKRLQRALLGKKK